MYLSGIEAFQAIVQAHSLKAASRQLHLTQSTVSYRLKKLEQEIGGTLIERSKGVSAVSLTPFGENFISIADRWSLLLNETEILKSAGPRLSLAVGGTNTLNTYLLAPLYRAMTQLEPQIRLKFHTQHSMWLYDSLDHREVDVAFVKRKLTFPNIIVEPFYEDEMVLVKAPVSENFGLKEIRPQELSGEKEMYIDSVGWDPSYREWHDRWWGSVCTARIRIDSAGLIFPLLKDSGQWAIAPRSIAQAFADLGKCVILKLSDAPPSLTYYKITHKNPKSETVRCLDILDGYLTTALSNFSKTF